MSYRSPVVRYFGQERIPGKKVAAVPLRESPKRARTANVDIGRRKQLETILDKEQSKATKERVSYVLVQKLGKKFGTKYLGIISFFVEEFLNTHDTIMGPDLLVLEKEIMNAINAKMTDAPKTSEEEQAETKAAEEAQESAEAIKASAESLILERPATGTEWQLIQTYQVLVSEDKEKNEKERKREKRMDFKKSLDEHIAYAKKMKEKELEDKKMYATYVAQDVSKFKQQEMAKQAAILERQEKLAALRKQQQREREERLRKEQEDFRKAYEKNLRYSQLKSEEEKMKLLEQKKKGAQLREIMLKETASNEQRKEEQRRIDAEEDQRLMREYAAKLDQEALDRENAFRKRMAAQEAKGVHFESSAGKELKEQQLAFERQLMKEQLKKAEADEAADRKKREDARMRQQLAMQENERQREQRRRQWEEEKQEDERYREKFQHDMDEFTFSEAEKKRRHKERQAQYRSELNRLMDSNKKMDKSMKGISSVEKEINSAALKGALEDAEMLSRVLHRVRLAKRPVTAQN